MVTIFLLLVLFYVRYFYSGIISVHFIYIFIYPILMYLNDTGTVPVFDTKQVQMQYISRICT